MPNGTKSVEISKADGTMQAGEGFEDASAMVVLVRGKH